MKGVSKLLYKRLVGSLTSEESDRLEHWISSNKYNEEVARRMSDRDFLEREYRTASLIDTERARSDMEMRIAYKRSRHKTYTYLVASVAFVMIMAAAFAAIIHTSQYKTSEPMILAGDRTDTIKNFESIKPGKTMARLTSSTGQVINFEEETSAIANTNILHDEAAATRSIADLKLEVPRGGEFRIMLEDSTEVWLNSESTLIYPETFGADERRVELIGEAFFSVRYDEERPFYVVSGDQQVRVYGTTFNIRGYADEPLVKTTLEEGLISISNCDSSAGVVKLSPGHQGIFDKQSKHLTLRSVNPDIIAGWRHGRFVFEDQTLGEIMRDLSRWYNFEYEFADRNVAEIVFKGSIPRYSDLATAILILESSGSIEFTLADDDRIIISSGTGK